MHRIVGPEQSEIWREHYKNLALERRIEKIRIQAIWANRDPNLAEKQYRAAIERKQIARGQKCTQDRNPSASITLPPNSLTGTSSKARGRESRRTMRMRASRS